MNIRTLCLAILNLGEATGYEIKKLSTEGRFSYFVDASFGSIYPALNRLEADGLVTWRAESEPGRPARKVYSITEAGRGEFLKALRDLPAADVFRSEFLFVSLFAEYLPEEHVRKVIDLQLGRLRRDLSVIEEALADSDRPGMQWVARYGLNCIQRTVDHIESSRKELEAIAGTAIQEQVAAE